MTEKKTILVLFGGASPEHEVSCSSGASLIEAIDTSKYNVLSIGITKDGSWILTKASPEEIKDSTSWLEHKDNCKAVLSPDRRDHGLLIFEENSVRTEKIDLIFPIIHGETGEDGELQGLFEIADIPYVGCGVCASACSMDKSVTMNFARLCNVRCPEYFACSCEDFLAAPEVTAKKIAEHFNSKLGYVYPLFVKPASTGSSVGISKVNNDEEMMVALKLAAQYPGNLIIEENIEGKELKVAVLGTAEKAIVGELCEIEVNGIFNDFTMKYKSSGSHKKIPALVSEEVAKDLKDSALRIYNSLGCKGFARVDFFVKADDSIIFNEINTVPGFTPASIYSLMFDAAGIEYKKIVQELISMAEK